MNIRIKLCEGCIKELQRYNPYIDFNGRTIPLENIEIIRVDVQDCDNSNLDTQRPEIIDNGGN